MFRKIVSGLPFSPALVGQLGFYARRLKKEEATRRLGLVFTALALVVQSFAVFSPPEPANAASDSDMVRGGVRSINDILAIYDQSARGKGDFKDIMDYAGITRAELKDMKDNLVNSIQFGRDDNAVLTWGRSHRFSSSQGEVKHIIPRDNNATSTVYSRPLWRFDSLAYTQKNGSTYDAFIGHSAKIGWFGIQKDCGNLMTRKTPKPVPAGKIVADCRTIRGFAYDGRKLDAKVKVYVYVGGPAGKGERIGPLNANQLEPAASVGKGHGFSVEVPEKYKTASKATPVFGVMIPLAGWNQSSVDIGSAQIPGNCNPPAPTPVASCVTLKPQLVDRTKFALTATASKANGATIKAYEFVVKDASGKVVYQKTITSAEVTAKTEAFDLKNQGSYSASVVVKTSTGDKTSANCVTALTVAPPEMCPLNPALPKNSPDCKPCPGDSSIWYKDENCEANIVQGKEVRNLTQNVADANNTTVKSGDRIEYTIHAENTGLVAANVEMNEELGDVLEYASLQDLGGAQFNDQAKVLGWGSISLAPGEKQTRKFVVTINNDIPATPQGTSEPSSFDCVMLNTYGNNTTLNVECPAPKVVEQVVKELPSTGPTENLLFGGGMAMVVSYFYARSKQMSKEVRLIRRDFNMGTI